MRVWNSLNCRDLYRDVVIMDILLKFVEAATLYGAKTFGHQKRKKL
jgi:hypothetical protein